MTVLRGNLALVKMQVSDLGVLSKIERIERSTNNILDQIEFTKDYQRTGSASPVWHRVAEFLLDPLQYMELESLEVSDMAKELEILADPMMSKVLNNLLENSIRYGGRPVKMRMDCHESKDGLLLVYEDSGQGVPYEDKDRIFEKGFGKGTGLGLFLSREILAITGISIRETGEPGKGARFEMFVPRGKFRSLHR